MGVCSKSMLTMQRLNLFICFITPKIAIWIQHMLYSAGYDNVALERVIYSVASAQMTESLLKIGPWYVLVQIEIVANDLWLYRVRNFLQSIFARTYLIFLLIIPPMVLIHSGEVVVNIFQQKGDGALESSVIGVVGVLILTTLLLYDTL